MPCTSVANSSKATNTFCVFKNELIIIAKPPNRTFRHSMELAFISFYNWHQSPIRMLLFKVLYPSIICIIDFSRDSQIRLLQF